MPPAAVDRHEQLLIPPDWGRNNIGIIRLVLAIVVIFSHSYPLLQGSYAHEPVYALFPKFASLGSMAVVGFFAISGLLITESWIRHPILNNYMLRRFVRIWPGFVAASFVMLLLIVPPGTDRPSAYLASLGSVRVAAGHLARAVLLKQPRSDFGF